jgi:hypothetical protein
MENVLQSRFSWNGIGPERISGRFPPMTRLEKFPQNGISGCTSADAVIWNYKYTEETTMTTGQFLYRVGIDHPHKLLGIVPACGGDEEPMRNIEGEYMLYVHNVFTRKSGWMDLKGDIYVDIEKTHYLTP